MYIAYSSIDTPEAGTTNLHLDISDALNLIVYIGKTKQTKGHAKKMLKTLEKTDCNREQIDRFMNGETPGALWHLFRQEDADKIRNYIAMKKLQKRETILSENDPIHDQTNYLDNEALKLLKKEYDVEVYTIVQFLGDAVFIPSGAPHQVRNLNSCIKVALDYVSPQGVKECLNITEQLRHLSDTHVNREDKLQVISLTI